MKKILFMLLLCTPLLYMGCKAEPEWVNLIAQQEQEKGQEEKREEADSEFKWANLADSCTTVLINQFMNKPKGTFWASPANESNNSGNIYWQQAGLFSDCRHSEIFFSNSSGFTGLAI